MHKVETKAPLYGYFSRCIAMGLVLWLLLLAACGNQNSTFAPTPTPTAKCPPAVSNSGQALSSDNTIYMFRTPCTTRFWRAGTIVVIVTSVAGGAILPAQQPTLNQNVTAQVQLILNHSLILDRSMKAVLATPLADAAGQSTSVLLGSTLALFLSLQIQFNDGSTALMGDDNLVKVVNAINNNNVVVEKKPITPKNAPGVFINSVSPDWLTEGGGGGFSGGHPDGSPGAVSDGTIWSTSCASGSGPLVYVLDTAHPLGIDQSGNPVHTGATKLLADPSIPTITPNVVPEPPAATPACDFSHDIGASTKETDVILDDTNDYGLKIFNPNSVNPDEFREHGLFVSDIIHHIAPQASIRLILVLNDYGVGDLQALFYGFQLISEEQAQEHIRGATVNMSLGLAPPTKCLQSIWNNLTNWENQYGGTREQPQANVDACAGNAAAIIADPNTARLYFSLGLMIHALAVATGDQLVAAAGNDSPAFGAELPAGFCDVVAVGATTGNAGNGWLYTASTKLASFSNVPYFDGTNCLSINLANGKLVEQPGQADHAVVAVGSGICSLLLHGVNDPPMGPKGLASWQGTSFSTAMISGNLAKNGGTLPVKLDETQPCG
jgi:hypothetical protein